MMFYGDNEELATADADRFHTSLHEAGRAVVAAYLRVPFSIVSAVPYPAELSFGYIGTTPRRTLHPTPALRRRHAHEEAMMLLGARAAIQNLPELTPQDWADLGFDGDTQDAYEDPDEFRTDNQERTCVKDG